MKPSKRQVTFLSLIWGLNHNINKQNLAKFGFALSLQKPIKGPLHRRGRFLSQPNFTELSLKLSNYELRTLFNKANCGLRITPPLPPGVTVIRGIKKGNFSIVKSQCRYVHITFIGKITFKSWMKHRIKWFDSSMQRLKNMYQMHVWYCLSLVFYGLQLGFRLCHNSTDLNSVIWYHVIHSSLHHALFY